MLVLQISGPSPRTDNGQNARSSLFGDSIWLRPKIGNRIPGLDPSPVSGAPLCSFFVPLFPPESPLDRSLSICRRRGGGSPGHWIARPFPICLLMGVALAFICMCRGGGTTVRHFDIS